MLTTDEYFKQKLNDFWIIHDINTMLFMLTLLSLVYLVYLLTHRVVFLTHKVVYPAYTSLPPHTQGCLPCLHWFTWFQYWDVGLTIKSKGVVAGLPSLPSLLVNVRY